MVIPKEIDRQWENEFVSHINHAIRTPLSSILGYAEMMYDSRQNLREKLDCIGRIRGKVREIAVLLEDSIRLAQMEGGILAPKFSSFCLFERLAGELSDIRGKAGRRRLGFRVHSPGPVPAVVVSDPKMLSELVRTAATGILDRMERGTLVVVMGTDPCSHLILRWEYTGAVPPQNDEHCLWLSLSARLSALLGGKLVIGREGMVNFLETSAGQVTEFTEQIPDIGGKPSSFTVRHTRPSLSGMRILLVDDDPDMHRITQHVLGGAGLAVESALSGEEALEKVRDRGFDLILMDIEMPRLSGYEATELLRKSGCDSPIVALTAHRSEAVRGECMRHGCTDYAQKPLAIDDLIDVIGRFSTSNSGGNHGNIRSA